MSHTSLRSANAISSSHAELWHQIQNFSLDQPGIQLSFSDRLARENQWSSNYTQRVVAEYKKFLFLTVTTEQAVVPSAAVDQVWHGHLTYTHSYWNELCGQVLKKPLHHHPTQGGAAQKAFFFQAYGATLANYKAIFGQPPADIWPAPELRFGQISQVKRIDTQAYWLLPKPAWARRCNLRQLRWGRSPRLLLVSVLTLVLLWWSVAAAGAIAGVGALDTVSLLAPMPQPGGMISPPPDMLPDGSEGEIGSVATFFRLVISGILTGFGLLFVSAGLCLGIGLILAYRFDQGCRRRPRSRTSASLRDSNAPTIPTGNSYAADSDSSHSDSHDICGACI